MPIYVALLRAVNLGPHNRIAAADLRAAVESTGARNVRTLLASGNAVFESKARGAAAVAAAVGAALARDHGLDTPVLVRDAAAWRAVVGGNPFPAEAKADPSHLVIMPLDGKPAAGALAALEAAIPGRERVALRGTELYLYYPDGIGTSKLGTALLERKLGVSGTGRNWNTALKILAFMDAS
jgi:uncharacterized protein (DUF1697 family)